MAPLRSSFAVLCLLLTQAVFSIDVDLDDKKSVIKAAKTIADDLINNYVSKESPRLLPYPPYFWWESGAMWGVMLDYWFATGDDTYTDIAVDSIQSQVGEDKDLMPAEQSFTMGNDDQAFWALTVMTAAETNFKNPPTDAPSWLGLAQAVFNEQVGRWDDSTCAGGIHWQVFQTNGGYNLKNTISNGALMQLAARLARYTSNDHYSDWATKLWDWMWHVGLIDNESYKVYDNTDSNFNCTTLEKSQWTYNAGTILAACATMYNYTEDAVWKNRTDSVLDSITSTFFPRGIMTEGCEQNVCNVDQVTFKAYLSRWMALATQVAPHTTGQIMPLLKSSATAAMEQCSGTFFPDNCGLKWSQNGTWDGSNGPGQQMASLEVLISTIVQDQQVPLTNKTGGTSTSDFTAGRNKTGIDPGSIIHPASHGDKIGAWILTIVIILATMAGCYFLWSPSFELRPGNLNNPSLGSKGGFLSSMNFGSSKVEKSSIHMGGLLSSK